MPTHLKGNRLVIYGDSIWEFEYNYRSPLTRILTSRGVGSACYNLAVGGACFGRHPNAHYDALSMVEVSNATVLNKWTAQDAAVTALKPGDNNSRQVGLMKALRPLMYNPAIIVLAFGTNDFGQNRPIGEDDDMGKETFKGAVNWVLTRFMGNYRSARVMLGTPPWKANADVVNSAGHKLIDYVDAIVRVGALRAVPVLDLYRCSGINSDNASTLLADGTHPSGEGYELLGNIWASTLLSRF